MGKIDRTRYNYSQYMNSYLNHKDKRLFSREYRSQRCLLGPGLQYMKVEKLFDHKIQEQLELNCPTIEHQFIKLRSLVQLSHEDYQQRYSFTRLFLDCLERHHKARYEGVLFGSTVNGLGFKDADVDLRLRAIEQIRDNHFEAINLDDETVESTLRNIAYFTNLCCPSKSEFVPSIRCPVAKLKFFFNTQKGSFQPYKEGLNYDISLSSKNTLGSYNSAYLKFLCHLRPKFHLLAITLRFWSKCHALIQPGDLSSYALINLLIYFCQVTDPPILPTVDEMRQKFLDTEGFHEWSHRDAKQAITQIEWHCLMCIDASAYPKCENQEPLSLLLLKFFEFYLKFPFSTQVITIRPGRSFSHECFMASAQYHPKFPIRRYVNIQDPFDLKHNLTSGLEGRHFRRLMVTIRYSYERLHHEIMTRFIRPLESNSAEEHQNHNGRQRNDTQSNDRNKNNKTPQRRTHNNWGLNNIFQKLTEKDFREA